MMFNEENTVEQMVLDRFCGGVSGNMVTEEQELYAGEIKGWRFVPADELLIYLEPESSGG